MARREWRRCSCGRRHKGRRRDNRCSLKCFKRTVEIYDRMSALPEYMAGFRETMDQFGVTDTRWPGEPTWPVYRRRHGRFWRIAQVKHPETPEEIKTASLSTIEWKDLLQ